MDLHIEKDEAAGRFAADVGGQQAYVSYEESEGVLDLRSTWVPPAHRNQGIGERLVLFALDHARAKGQRVVPTCPFIPSVIERHPEYRDLVKGA